MVVKVVFKVSFALKLFANNKFLELEWFNKYVQLLLL